MGGWRTQHRQLPAAAPTAASPGSVGEAARCEHAHHRRCGGKENYVRQHQAETQSLPGKPVPENQRRGFSRFSTELGASRVVCKGWLH